MNTACFVLSINKILLS